jgi:hypothetical protein
MRCRVVLMRENGRRLPAASITSLPGELGDLLLTDWTSGSSFGRSVRVARLCAVGGGTKADPLKPLFDPTLVLVTSDSLVIVGIEVGADSSGTQIDYAQSWLVRPLADSP